ncbi:YcxB family protein [Tenacibaculum halocynthiae]|uniref:YcxB family protein n=1 Tax=Tenacibaculum halocynthiae TaxID=1254437 RepID=UPI0038958234
MEKEIIIKPIYRFKDFTSPLINKIFKSWGIWFVFFLAFLMLIFNIIFFFDNSIYTNESIPTINIIIPLLVFIIFPFSFYFGLKKNYNNNKILKEKTTVIYTKDGIKTIGESYNNFIQWSQINYIKEHKTFFLFKNTNGQESYLNKNFFSQKKLNDFKTLIKNLGY